MSIQASGLDYVEESERASAVIDDIPAGVSARTVASVAVIGAGTMGSGIAMSVASAGLPVVLVEQSDDALERGMAGIRGTFARAVEKGRLAESAMRARLALIQPTTDLTRAAAVDLLIEAVFETIGAKESVFLLMDAIARPGAILASNTSSLNLDRIASFTGREADVVGLHFFSPAQVMRLVEIVRGAATAPDVLVTAMAFAKRIGKIGVIAGVCDGFIGNRMFERFMRQAYALLQEGALPWQVDQALEAWGMAMGPFAVMDLAGNDVGYAVRKSRAAGASAATVFAIPDRIAEMGRYGQKTGAGYYRYDPVTRRRSADPEVERLILDYVRETGRARREIDDAEIVARCVLALVNEGARLLGEGIAQRASDIDVIYRNGYGFPASRGGPMYHADELGLPMVMAAIDRFRRDDAAGAWEPAPLLLERLADGRRLLEI